MLRGFKEHDAADRFCREPDKLRNFLRTRSRHNQCVPAARRRRRFLRHACIAMGIIENSHGPRRRNPARDVT
jgi:putative transposase